MDLATVTKPSTTPCHLVAMPYAGRGHINPMMNLCKLLSSKANNNPHRLRITFVITEEWFGLIGSDTKPPTITFATIPNVLPSEQVRAADMRSFLLATMTKMADPFERILDRIEVETKSAVNIIIADTFLNWAVDVGNRRGIPVASFWPMSAITFRIFYDFDLVKQHGHHLSKDQPELEEEIIDYIPGISSIRVADLPSVLQENVFDDFVFPVFPYVKKTQYLISTSIFELESHIFHSIKQDFPFPVLSFGPLIPYLHIQNTPTSTHADDGDYYNWLDNQPPMSVLYVSLGSFLSVSDTQLDEIEAGLDHSGVSYFWVARNDASKRKRIRNSSCKGIIVPWCNQLQVLSHPSIGGFWTHCGWNSTVEAIFSGVPMLTFPISIDQFPNSKLIVDDWKIGSRVVETKKLLVNRGHIAKVVKEFMDSGREERRELLRNVKEKQKICRKAAEVNGSSAVNIDKFLDDIGVLSSN